MEQENQNDNIALDDLIQDRQLQMMKAAIPYINQENQRSLAIMIKFMELRRTMSIFENTASSVQICSVNESTEPAQIQLLNALREFCTEKEQESIDMLLNYLQMFSAYETLWK